jgi:hypothetical protein
MATNNIPQNHTWKPDDSMHPQYKAWDEDGNLIGYVYQDGVITFDKPPSGIMFVYSPHGDFKGLQSTEAAYDE